MQRGFQGKPGEATFVNEEVPCTKCKGNGLHPIAYEALTSAGVNL